MDCPDVIMGLEESSSKVRCSEDNDGEKRVLRTVTLPGDLISKFLDVAKVNSDQNIKTLGTLSGVKIRYLETLKKRWVMDFEFFDWNPSGPSRTIT